MIHAMVYNTLAGIANFNADEWAEVSPSGKAIVQAMLNNDPTKRPSARQLLRHEWFKVAKTKPSASLGSRMVHRLQQFTRMSKLRKLALVVLARHMVGRL